MAAQRSGLTQALGPMKRVALLLTFPFIATACSGNKDAASSVAEICQAQEVGSRFRTPDRLPRNVELWKPNGEQVSVGIRQSFLDSMLHREKQASCTLTIGSNQLVTRIDSPAGA